MTMKTKFLGSLSMLLLFSLTGAQAALPDNVMGQPVTSLAPLVEQASPAVVNIRVSQTVSRGLYGNEDFRRFFGFPESQGRPQEVSSAGSGVIVDAARGYILTNHHVVGGADKIQITLFDGKTLDAEVVGSDPATDIAVIRVEADGLTDMPIGDSSAVRVGDFVIAIGNPFGLGHTVTSGIISALGRSGVSRDTYEDFIQTDASINPGNSGGALVNMNGELIGINSAIISRSGGNVGIGFAVPTEIAGSIMSQLLDFGDIRRGLLGVIINTIDADSAVALGSDIDSGAIITDITSDSAAERAGLEVGDIIVAVNHDRVESGTELRNKIGLLRSGDKVDIEYVRGNQTRSLSAILGGLTVPGEEIHSGLAGSVFEDAGTSGGEGIEITGVEENSPAAQRGLQRGDKITHVNRNPVEDLEDLRAIASRNRILFLNIHRGERTLMIQIR